MAATKSIIPAAAVYDQELGSATLRVLCALGTFANSNGACWPAVSTLVRLLGVSDRQVRRHLHRLKAFGYIEIEERLGNRNLYQIIYRESEPKAAPTSDTHDISGHPRHPAPTPPDTEHLPPLGAQHLGPLTLSDQDPRCSAPTKRPKNDPLNEEENAVDDSQYAFHGEIIKLNRADLVTWTDRYHGIPDIMSELSALDQWYATEDARNGKNWFHRASASLNKKHQEWIAKQNSQSPEPEARYSDGVY